MTKVIFPEALDFSEKQKKTLKESNISYHTQVAKTTATLLDRTAGYDTVVMTKYTLQDILGELYDKHIVGLFSDRSWVDDAQLARQGLTLQHLPGCNAASTAQWILDHIKQLIPDGSLHQYHTIILGRGHIGQRVAHDLDEQYGVSDLSFLTRETSLPDLIAQSTKPSLLINCLSNNASTQGLINSTNLSELVHGSYYISIANTSIDNYDDLRDLLISGQLAGCAHDLGDVPNHDTAHETYHLYDALPNTIITPHIAGLSGRSDAIDMALHTILAAQSDSGSSSPAVGKAPRNACVSHDDQPVAVTDTGLSSGR